MAVIKTNYLNHSLEITDAIVRVTHTDNTFSTFLNLMEYDTSALERAIKYINKLENYDV